MKGSPGATMLGVGLAAAWPGTASVIVELDPSGGDVAVRFQTGQQPGLVSLAAAARRNSPTAEVAVDLLEHAHDLGNHLYTVPAPVGADQARAGVELVASHAAVLRTPLDDGAVDVVVVDLGRLDPSSPVTPLLGDLDVLLVAARGGVTDLAHLAARGPELADLHPAPGLVGMLLTQGCRYRTRDVEEAVGLSLFAAVPHDDLTATALMGEPATARLGRGGHRLGSRPLMRALRDLAERLADLAPPRDSGGPIATMDGEQPALALTASHESWAVTSPGRSASHPAVSAAQAGWTRPAPSAQPAQTTEKERAACENPWVLR